MVKKFGMVVSMLAFVSVLGLFAVGIAFAQSPAPTPSTPAFPWGAPWEHFGGGVSGGSTAVWDAIGTLLGMTPGQINDAYAAGKTVHDLAQSKGITNQQVIDAMVAAQKSVLDQAVKDGRLTQAQADGIEAQMEAVAPSLLTSPAGVGGAPFAPAGAFGPGGRGGWRGLWGWPAGLCVGPWGW